MSQNRPKLLIVDEDPAIQTKFRESLERNGFEVFQTGDVADAIHRAQIFKPDLILINLGLPGGGGALGIKRIKALMPLKDIPIIAFSNEDPSQAMKEALLVGASDFISKKVEDRWLIEMIRSHLNPRTSS